MDLLDKTAQYGAWAHLNIVGDAFRRKATDDLLPPNWRRDLLDERVDRRRRVTLRLRIDVGDNRDTRVPDPERAKLGLEPLLRRLQQRAVERRTDGERNHTPGAERFRPLARTPHRRGRSGNYDLPGAVDVRGADDLAVGGLFTCPGHGVGVETQNRCHRTGADRHGFLHVLSAASHGPHGIRKLERLRGHIR